MCLCLLCLKLHSTSLRKDRNVNIHLQPAGPRAGDRTGQWSASPSHARATARSPHRRPRRAARRVRGPHHLTVITLLRPRAAAPPRASRHAPAWPQKTFTACVAAAWLQSSVSHATTSTCCIRLRPAATRRCTGGGLGRTPHLYQPRTAPTPASRTN